LLDKPAKPRFIHSVFSLDGLPSCAFPHPSLALTSALGNIFLPHIVHSTDTPTDDRELLSTNGRFCLFYTSILDAESHLMIFLEDGETDTMNRLLYFLFLHTAFAKDKLALPTANSLWTKDSGIGETDFMDFQSICIKLLEMVCHPFS
jgi:hypothetical protein